MATLATVGNSEIKVTKMNVATITGIVALITAVVPVVNAAIGGLVSRFQQQSTTAVELAKLDQERRKLSIDLHRIALADPDPMQRMLSVRYLVAAGLVPREANGLKDLTAEQIPRWPAASGTTP